MHWFGQSICFYINGMNVLKNNEVFSKYNFRKVFRDVVTMCGTHPALLLIKGWIGRQQIEGEEAAQMIASLPTHIYSPSKKLFEDFFVSLIILFYSPVRTMSLFIF